MTDQELELESLPPDFPTDQPDEFYRVNLGELSDVFKISQTTFRNYIRRYEDFPIENRGANGVPYEFDVRKVGGWLQTHEAEAEASKTANRERVDQLRLQFLGAELEADPAAQRLSPKEEGDLIDARFKAIKLNREHNRILVRADFETALAEAFTACRDEVLGLVDHLARELSLDRANRNAVEAQLEAALRRLAGRLQDPTLYGDKRELDLNG